ncbi:MAG: DUF1289 domain-containing protein [Rickettsiales bacterium]|nr:DUF1289 domain-containing protein [Rickettsiales bacterium]|tara:strand:- start:543 stop:710 length:168 start_codon:yes stop_codon:yes gene_type:complete
MTINSPCLGICKLDADRKNCTSCFRSIDEIENWINFSFKQKKKILKELSKRRQKK